MTRKRKGTSGGLGRQVGWGSRRRGDYLGEVRVGVEPTLVADLVTAPSISHSPTKCSFIHPCDKVIVKHFLFQALCQPDMQHGELNRHGP